MGSPPQMAINLGVSTSAEQANRTPRKLGRRPVLDGLRGVAVLLVMLMHTGVLLNGFIGVDLFFGLSGFLITSLLFEEWERHDGISFRRFYERRARRLLPALILLLAALMVVDACCYRLTGWSIEEKSLTTLLFVNNWVAGLGNSHQLGSLGPTWSLAQEDQFYLLWPLALWMLLRWRVRPIVIVGLLALAIVVALLLSPTVASHVHNYNAYFSPIDRATELLAGCAAAVIWRHRMIPSLSSLHPRSDRVATVLHRATPWAREAFAFALLYFFLQLLIGPQAPLTRNTYLVSLLIGIPFMVTMLDAERGLLGRLLTLTPLRFIGRISYSLYLFHLLVRNVVYHYLPQGSVLGNAAITVSISILLATASWYLVESRILSAGGRSRSAATQAHRPAMASSRPRRGPVPDVG